MIYRVFIDFNKLIEAANGIYNAPEKEQRLKLLYEYQDKEILIKADSMVEAINKVHEVFGTDPITIEETNFAVI